MRASTIRLALRALTCALTLWASSASAALVTLGVELMEAHVPGDFKVESSTAIPSGGSLFASSGFGSSRIERTFQSAGNVTTLAYRSNYSREFGPPRDEVLSNLSSGILTFSVSQAATYNLSGAMAVDDPFSGRPGRTYGKSLFDVYLIDITNSPPASVLMNSAQSLTAVEDASFVLGESGLVGSLTGSLQPGRIYEFLYRSRVETLTDTGYTTMTAVSSVSLRITAAATEPPPGTPMSAPGTLGLLLAAALGYGFARRRS